MKLNLFNREKIELAGLDIGSSAVKVVRLNKSEEGYTLVNAAIEPITSCSDDQEQQRQNCIDAIKACLQKTGLNNCNVVCGISGPEVVVRGFTFPPLPDQAVEQAVRMEAQQVCPLDMKHSVLDFQLIEAMQPESTGGAAKATSRQGVMTVGTESVIREQTELLTRAGAKPIMVDVDTLALLNCLNELGLSSSQETIAIIDIGHTLTNVVVYGLDGLPFVRDINIAGFNIIKDISRQTELSEDQIQQAFMRGRLSETHDGNLLLALNNAIGPLVNAINETLRFYSFQEKKSGVDRIHLCGGLSLIDAFVEFMTDAVSVPVDLLNPFSIIQPDPEAGGSKSLVDEGPAFAVATGLAMRTL